MIRKIVSFCVVGLLLAWGAFVYQAFFVDTSIDPQPVRDMVDTSDTIAESQPEQEQEQELEQERMAQILPVSVSDWRDFSTVEATTTMLVEWLDAPWGFVFLPKGNILVTERFGSLLLIDSEWNAQEITWVPEVFAGGQWGLLDVTIHPGFTNNNYVYLSYAHGNEEWNRLRVARGVLNNLSLEDVEVIFEVAQTKNWAQHFWSRFQWLPDGTLVFSVGDGGNPPTSYNGELIREQAQNLTAHLWKTIRINDDGSIPDDNPFIGRPDVRQEIYTYWHRNIQGIGYDASRGRLIASEHGSKGGDELNHIQAGANYGWPRVTYATEYDMAGTPIAEAQTAPEYEDPLVVWTPTIAPSEVVYNDGDQYPDWQGNLFVAAMLLRANNTIGAYASSPAGAVLRLMMDAEGNVVSQERILVWDVRVRSIELGPDGYLYVLTDSTWRQSRPGANAGTLLRIE